MSAKSPGAALALIVLISLPLFGLLVENSEPNKNKCHPCETKCDDSPRTVVRPSVRDPGGERTRSDKSETDDPLGKITDWLLAGFTLALVIYTRRLYQSTAGLFTETAALRMLADKQRGDMLKSIEASEKAAEATKLSAAIAERALVELERPIIAADINESELEITEDNGIFGVSLRRNSQITLANYGRTPAMLIEYSIHFDVVPKGTVNLPAPVDMTRKEGLAELPYGVFIVPGKPLEFMVPDNISLFTADHISKGKYKAGDGIFFMIYFKFEDVFHIKYVSGYCGQFFNKERKFIKVGGDEYNYCRKADDQS